MIQQKHGAPIRRWHSHLVGHAGFRDSRLTLRASNGVTPDATQAFTWVVILLIGLYGSTFQKTRQLHMPRGGCTAELVSSADERVGAVVLRVVMRLWPALPDPRGGHLSEGARNPASALPTARR